MQKNRIQFMVVCCVFVAVLFLAGCDLSKEVVLEHSDMQISAESQELSEDASKEASPAQIYVYICGQVYAPGVYMVDENARVFDVITLAGGLTDSADLTGINQAQTLCDGQMIYVPAEGEQVSSLGNGTSQTEQDSSVGKRVNINTADLEGLMSLPGIGEGKAQSILRYRQEHGPFRNIEEIMNVEGIKEGTYTKFKDKITV